MARAKGIPVIQKQVAAFLSQLREGSFSNFYFIGFLVNVYAEFSVKRAPNPQSPPPIPEPVTITTPPPTPAPTSTTTTTTASKEKRYFPILLSSSIIVMLLYFVNRRLR